MYKTYLDLINTSEDVFHFKPVHYGHGCVSPNPIHHRSKFKEKGNQHKSASCFMLS